MMMAQVIIILILLIILSFIKLGAIDVGELEEPLISLGLAETRKDV